MLKMLKFDFYKIFKSKALLSVFIVSRCVAFLDPLSSALIYKNDASPFLDHISQWMAFEIFIFIFVVPFVCKDFSSKFIKNTYSSYSFADKLYYVLSKAIYIFAICVIWFLLHFASYLICDLIECAIEKRVFEFVSTLTYSTPWNIELFRYFCLMINCFARGMLCMFLCMLFKREYIVIVLIVLYTFFLNDLLYQGLYNAMGEIKGHEFVWNYTIYGMSDRLPGDGGVKMARLTNNMYVMFGYSFGFIVLSWLCFIARGVANKLWYFIKGTIKASR